MVSPHLARSEMTSLSSTRRYPQLRQMLPRSPSDSRRPRRRLHHRWIDIVYGGSSLGLIQGWKPRICMLLSLPSSHRASHGWAPPNTPFTAGEFNARYVAERVATLEEKDPLMLSSLPNRTVRLKFNYPVVAMCISTYIASTSSRVTRFTDTDSALPFLPPPPLSL